MVDEHVIFEEEHVQATGSCQRNRVAGRDSRAFAECIAIDEWLGESRSPRKR